MPISDLLSDSPEDSSSDESRTSTSRSAASRAPRKARARISLKMQAIGYLSRREHSRQELRKKLLASLRQREREDAALAAASEAAVRELAQASSEQVSNGIDDAFAPPPPPMPARRGTRRAQETPRTASVIEQLRLANGAVLPERLRAELALQADIVSEGGDSVGDAPVADPALEKQDPEAAVDQLLDWLVANQYLSEPRFVESRVNARSRKQGAMMIKFELARHGLVLEPEQAAALRETEFARAQALWQRKFGELAPDARLRAKQARFLVARGFASDVVRRVVGGEEDA